MNIKTKKNYLHQHYPRSLNQELEKRPVCIQQAKIQTIASSHTHLPAHICINASDIYRYDLYN